MVRISRAILVTTFILASAAATGTNIEGNNAKEKKFKLLSGDLMPMVGWGSYKIVGTELVKEALDHVLAAGYRLIDTAKFYRNEEDIGKALKELLPKYNLTRSDIFITTKLLPDDQGEKAYSALEESLKKLDSGYIDLYLIHWPGLYGLNASDKKHAELRDKSWEQLVKGVKNGLTKNIGVSNYKVKHMNELLANNHGIKPAVNQIEWHPHYHPSDILELCQKEGILLQAYSSLGGSDNNDLLHNPEVEKIAQKLNKSPAQVLLRWALQQDIAIIPKARSKQHIDQNIDLDFEIPEDDIKTLGSFKQQKYAWDSINIA